MVSFDGFVDLLPRLGRLIFYFNYYFVISIIDFFRQFIYPKQKSIKNEIVLITGGAGGLGVRLCRKFVELGATVVVWDVNEEAMDSTKRTIYDQTGHIIHCYKCDVRSREEVMKIASKVNEEVGPVSILVNNAAIICGKKILEFSERDIERSFGINLFSNYWTIQAFLPDMIEKRHGHIVAISSIVSKMGVVQMSEYCANKAGMTILMESLTRELFQMGLSEEIHTTCVNSGFIATDMFKKCCLRYPVIVPDLNPDYVVDRIMHAILSNQRMLMIGRIMYFLIPLFSILPQRSVIMWDEFIGSIDFMKNFGK